MESRELALRGRGRRERNEEAAAEVEVEEVESSATFAAIALASRQSWDTGVVRLAWLCWHVLPRCRWASPWPYATWALHIGPLIGPALT